MCHRRLKDVLYVPELALGLKSRGESDSVVEGQTECIVGDVVALAAVEEVLLQIVTNSKQGAAGCVDGTVHAIGAQCTLGHRT